MYTLQNFSKKKLSATSTVRPLAAVLLLAVPAFTAAQNYPVKPVRFIVGYPAGGANDVLARVLGPELNEALGQPFLVENRPGAGGNLGTELVAKAAPDGYWLLLGSTGPQGVAPTLYSKLPFDPATQIAAVSLVAISGNLVVVHPSLPAKNVRELIALAKARPGQLSYASQGNGSTGHLATELFKSMAKIDMVHIPYKGDALALIDVIAGEVPLLFSGVPPGLPHVRSGRVRLLAVTPRKRLKALPEVPTIAESGVPGYDVTTWYGLFTTGGTDPAIIDKLAREVARIVALAHVQEDIARQGMEATSSTPADFSRFVKNEIEKWGKVVRAIGAKAD
jgi:tripartite-type tricarboxylate transporter receptor subunit TctC